jgi:hypothetical protein
MMTECLTGDQLLLFLSLLDPDLYTWFTGTNVIVFATEGFVMWSPTAEDPTIWCGVKL